MINSSISFAGIAACFHFLEDETVWSFKIVSKLGNTLFTLYLGKVGPNRAGTSKVIWKHHFEFVVYFLWFMFISARKEIAQGYTYWYC